MIDRAKAGEGTAPFWRHGEPTKLLAELRPDEMNATPRRNVCGGRISEVPRAVSDVDLRFINRPYPISAAQHFRFISGSSFFEAASIAACFLFSCPFAMSESFETMRTWASSPLRRATIFSCIAFS